MKICVLSLAFAVIAAAACSTGTLSVEGEFFGVTSHGDSTMLYTMTNSSGASVTVTDYGCKLVSVNVPDSTGFIDDVIVGYGNIHDTVQHSEAYNRNKRII